mmetsp:Transcript_20701/g.51569  ORF Transcript_20701/g.51569 Transcript_20701/m.51569 type:complete len:255 (-) Transcript_20701:89-853(-)|eukprot:CAMPEP_0197585018 /NCGR_PEP_ID=MMETSP1326-20131121/7451_1 /TAXON_ID=1155430 /ORGANISM="Genus nov. species nov., Strain RCC2288" /LENGTH=254 /DNA_ID=CAMNT_0043149469 /DNA_START=159 /DNA_END=923 /DNA_ORIENTATION=+
MAPGGGLFGSNAYSNRNGHAVYDDRRYPNPAPAMPAAAMNAAAAFESMTLNQNVRPGGGGAAHPGGSTVRRTLSVPKEFPGLLEMTSAELGTLLTDPAAFARFLHSTEGCREARAFTRDLRIEIEGMCRTNIEMAEEAGDLRSQMQVIRSCDMQPVKEGYDAVKARADALLRRYNLPKLLQGLKDRAAAADAACEELSEEYVTGKVPVDEFVDKYRKMREEYHKDAVKVSIVAPALQSQQHNHQQQHQQQHQRY